MSQPSCLPPIALVQMEVLPGRPDRNVARMLEYLDQARRAGAQIVAFPELCVSGYILGDVWEVDALVQDFAAYTEDLRAASTGLVLLFGNVVLDPERIGEDGRVRKYNAAVVCADGEYVARPGMPPGLPAGVHPKTLHPNYRFFDDDRHFYSLRKLAQSQQRSVYDWCQPFTVILPGGRSFSFGVQLCEDIWSEDYHYVEDSLDTLRAYHQRGAETVINLSSSPWTWRKNDKRNRVVRHILSRSPVPLLYVNHVGAQNNGKNVIVFDGDSTVYDPRHGAVQRARPWREQLLLTARPVPVPDEQEHVEAVYDAITTGILHLDHIRSCSNRYLIGVSGGIDSSVVACMLCQAVGPQRVYAVNMPTRFNAQVTQDNAQRLCTELGVDYLSCPIQDLYEAVRGKIAGARFARSEGEYTRLADENVQARVRGADVLAGLAAKHGLIFTNNGNKTEVALGYATLYGDVSGAIAPIADLYKTQVVELARFLNCRIYRREVIPRNLIDGTVVPSAELSAAQDVTRGLGDPIRYGYHDAVLRQLLEYRRHIADLLEWQLEGSLFDRLEWGDREQLLDHFADAEMWVRDLEWIECQLRSSVFKRVQAPPIVVLSKRAFGFDLREPQLPHYHPRHYEALREQVLSRGL